MPPSTWFDTLTLVAAWLVYFVIHSALASLALKRRVAVRWPGFMPAYRLVYNALAVVLLLPIAWIANGGGPMKAMPASVQACANDSFSERNP